MDSVTVYDPDDDFFWKIYPSYRNGGTYTQGYYILRTPYTTTGLEIDKYSSKTEGWCDPSESNYKPEKDKPYIFQFHDNYYVGKYMVIFGAGYQTIASDFTAGTAPASDEVTNICVNNTMHSADFTNTCYMLGDGANSAYWWRHQGTTTIYPFETYVLTSTETARKYFVLRRDGIDENYEEETPGIATETERVRNNEIHPLLQVYSVSGQLICTYRNTNIATMMETLQWQLPAGVYIIRGADEPLKLILGNR